MKKILITFLVLSLSIFQIHAYTLSTKDTQLVSKVVKIIDKKIQKKWESYQKNIIKLLKKYKRKSKRNTRKYEIIDLLIDEISDIDIIIIIIEKQEEENKVNTFNKYHVNTSKMRQYWLGLYTDYRNNEWLAPYKYDIRLEKSGNDWTDTMLSRWKISHERNPGDGYYNYPIIEQWFQDRWVKCKVSGRTTSVENTWYHAYYCPNGWDCTDKANKALKDIFDFYVAEKWLTWYAGAHYRTIVSPYLQYMWLGLSFKDEWNGWIQVYTAAHFCTEFE